VGVHCTTHDQMLFCLAARLDLAKSASLASSGLGVECGSLGTLRLACRAGDAFSILRMTDSTTHSLPTWRSFIPHGTGRSSNGFSRMGLNPRRPRGPLFGGICQKLATSGRLGMKAYDLLFRDGPACHSGSSVCSRRQFLERVALGWASATVLFFAHSRHV